MSNTFPVFQSEKSNVEWTLGDVFMRIVFPIIPLFGVVCIAGTVAFLVLDDGDDRYGVREEAEISVVWGMLFQTAYALALVLPIWLEFIVSGWSNIL